MKRIIIKTLGLSIWVFSSCACSEYINETLCLHSVQINLLMERGARCQVENYEEGIVYMFLFKNGGVLMVRQGSMMKTPMDDFKPSLTITKNHLIEMGEDSKGKMWRQDTYSNFKIGYFNVNHTEKKEFERILNSVKLNIPDV